MGDSIIATKQNNLGLSNGVDLTELAYSNRELVSYENSSINIDNSTDVIIGPVTKLNVTGNVTFIHGNGEILDNDEDEARKSSTTPYSTGEI